MTTPAAARFTGDIPRYYDQHLGPVIFESYARDLARRAADLNPTNVLEIASGTGISTVALRNALPQTTRITATDLNPAMLDIAKEKLVLAANVEFQQADAQTLPFGDGAFDLITSQFGVMFFPDRPAAYAEARRVLKPGAAMVFNVWGPMSANPFAQVAHEDAIKFFPENPPKFYLTPFGYTAVDQVYADLKAGGFTHISHLVVQIEQPVADWRHFATGLIHGNPMIVDIGASNTVQADDMVAAIAEELEKRLGEAPARMPLEATVYTAR